MLSARMALHNADSREAAASSSPAVAYPSPDPCSPPEE